MLQILEHGRDHNCLLKQTGSFTLQSGAAHFVSRTWWKTTMTTEPCRMWKLGRELRRRVEKLSGYSLRETPWKRTAPGEHVWGWHFPLLRCRLCIRCVCCTSIKISVLRTTSGWRCGKYCLQIYAHIYIYSPEQYCQPHTRSNVKAKRHEVEESKKKLQ